MASSTYTFRMTTVEEVVLDVGNIQPEFLKSVFEDASGFVGDSGWSWNDLGEPKVVSYTVEVVKGK